MSVYLPNDELTEEEQRIIEAEEKRYSTDVRRRRRLRAAHSRVARRIYRANMPRDEEQHATYATTPYVTTSAYIKIAVPSGEIQFNSNAFERVKNLIRRMYGRYCYGNTLKCTSITITPKPGSYCCLYYKADGSEWCPIGRFYSPAGYDKLRMPLKCPYVDSIFRNEKVVWPFYKNDDEGKIIPWNYKSEYNLYYNNQTMPFLEERMFGQISITGIEKEVTLDVIFIMPDDITPRQTPSYHRYLRHEPYWPTGPPNRHNTERRRISGQIGYENVPDPVQGPSLEAYDNWSDMDTDDIMAE